MYRAHSVGVVVPAYNEAGFVGDVVETLPEFVDCVFVIDDCSTDDTWAEIQHVASGSDAPSSGGGQPSPADDQSPSAAADRSPTVSADRSPSATEDRSSSASDELPRSDGGATVSSPRAESTAFGADQTTRVVPIQHEENRGVGAAIKTGYQHARQAELDVTVVVGGDGQMDPDVMPRLLDPIVEGKADYAKGNRLLDADHHQEMPRHRLFGNGVLTLLTKVATGYWQVGDPQMGYTAISLDAMEPAVVDEMYEYYGYCNDLLVRLSTQGYRIADVPCPLTYADEESHITYREYVPRVSAMLLGSFLRRLWSGKGSATGASRLGLFVGGALAVVGGVVVGLLGLLASAGGRSLRADGRDGSESIEGEGTGDEALVRAGAGDDSSPSAADVGGQAQQTDGAAGGCSSRLAVVAGVASLLAGMLVDATANATRNYTDRLSDDRD